MIHTESPVLASVSVSEHQQRILSTIRALPVVTLDIADALGRTLAEPVTAVIDVPGFDNSAMDGYALRHADASLASATNPVRIRIIADLPAGTSANPSIGAGEAARIMTGAPVPSDADCIVPIEHTETDGRTLTAYRAPARAAHIRRRGSDVRSGDAVLTAGRTLSARDLAAAAATGAAQLRVYRVPRVAVLSTGTELRPAGEPLDHGQIHDSNSTLLAAAVSEAGGIPVQLGSIHDDQDALREIFEREAPTVDAFVTSGGVSVGAYDVVKAVLAPLGVWFGPVRMQPGKPQGFGVWPDADSAATPIFALPGNPVGVFVSFEAFVRPALLAMQGRQQIFRETLRGVASSAWSSPADRVQYMPAVAERLPDGTLSVRPASEGGSGSYLVASLARANALVTVPESVSEVREGDLVDLVLLA